ncbi:MAG: L,D-transpeptidase family protein [Myxococcota bacterium]
MARNRLLAMMLLAPLAVAPACDRESGAAEAPSPAPTTESDPSSEPQAADEPAPSREALARRIRGFLDQWSQRERAFLDAWQGDFEGRLEKLSWFKQLRTKAYESRGYSLIFSDGQDLEPAADAMLAALDDLEAHALDPKPYEREVVEPLRDRVEDARVMYLDELAQEEGSKEAVLWELVQELRGSLAMDLRTIEVALAETELTDEDVPLVDRAEAQLGDIFEAKARLNDALRDLDLALLKRWYRYAYDMRFARRAHPFHADRTDAAGVERAADDLYALFEATDFDDLEAELARLEPQHPDYRELMKGLAFYRTLAEEVEHVELPASAWRLDKGAKGEKVELLQRRLAQEEYYDGEVDGVYGDELAEAVRFYQETHQFNETGRMDRPTLRSLNRDFQLRSEQIELALQRHRESPMHQGPNRFGEHPVQARINIPAFEAVFFRDGEAVRKHGVVVGNNGVEVDERTGLKGYVNRTRLFTAEMETVVLNPKWRVPSRIKEQELDMELLEEPDFYEKNGYEVKIRDDGREEVIQLPGPGNALGLVKFLFPNPYSIYMHDTPHKKLFEREIRAYSHGCMRTRDAMKLAEWILVDVQGLTPERFQEILDSRETYGIGLETKIPVSTDYLTVGVHDESGRMMFFADIYRFDRDYRRGKTPYAEPPEPHLEQVVLVR